MKFFDQPFDALRLRRVLGRFATGVTVVTTVDDRRRRFGMTVNSFASVSLEPPLILWSIDKGSPNLSVFAGCARFAVNILSSDQMKTSDRFAHPDPDKFAEIRHRPGLGGVPLLGEASAILECRMQETHEAGDHVIVIGRIERLAHHPRRPILAFAEGRYGVVVSHPDVENARPDRGAPAAAGDAPHGDVLASLLIRAYDKAFAGLAAALDDVAVTGSDMRILSCIVACGPRRLDDLQGAAMISESACQESIDRLMKRRCVEIDADGAVIVTEKGKTSLSEALDAARRAESAVAADLSDDELKGLKNLLRRLIADRRGGAFKTAENKA